MQGCGLNTMFQIKRFCSKDKYPLKFKFAFTLAEVLITLGILGVVAAFTIPTLVSRAQESVYINQLRTAYSIFSRAYKSAINEEGDPETWDIGQSWSIDGSLKLYNILKRHLQLSEDCGSAQGCFYTGTYKALFGNNYSSTYQPRIHPQFARARLANGMSFAIWSNGSGCENDLCGSIFVDINGDKKPNQAGLDFFVFNITAKNGVVGRNSNVDCKYKDTSDFNGRCCTAWVLQMGNMDYRRRDISHDWNKFLGTE